MALRVVGIPVVRTTKSQCEQMRAMHEYLRLISFDQEPSLSDRARLFESLRMIDRHIAGMGRRGTSLDRLFFIAADDCRRLARSRVAGGFAGMEAVA